MLRAMAAIVASLALAGLLGGPGASEAPPPGQDEPPGGYWSLSERRERAREPLDGDDELTIGAILFSLGLLRAGAAGVAIWMGSPGGLCSAADEGDCSGYQIYGFVGLGEAGLMVGTGIVYLAIGSSRRAKHRRWERGETVQLSPWFVPARRGPAGPAGRGPAGVGPGLGGGLQLQLRF